MNLGYYIRRIGLLMLTMSAIAIGGGGANGVGGGHVVVCRNVLGGIKSIELLDYYEAHELWGVDYDLNSARTYQEKIELAISRIKKIDPARAARYEGQFQTFEQDALRKNGISLVNLPDTRNLAFPSDCKVEQMITQSLPEFPEDHRYLIDQDLWSSNAFDDDNKAGIILHELIYREAIEMGQTDSRNSRYLNAYTTSDKLRSMSQEQYLRLLQLIQFNSYLAFGWVDLGDLSINLQVPALNDIIEFSPQGEIIEVKQGRGQIQVAGQPGLCRTGWPNVLSIEFYPGGALQSCPNVDVDGSTQVFRLPNQVLSVSPTKLSTSFSAQLFPNGDLQSLCYAKAGGVQPAFLEIQGVPLRIDASQCQHVEPTGQDYEYGSIEFYPSGALAFGFIQDAVDLRTVQGAMRNFASQFVYFDESGLATRWDPPVK